MATGSNDEIVFEVDGENRVYDVDLTSMYYPIQQQTIGRIVIFRERSAVPVAEGERVTDS